MNVNFDNTYNYFSEGTYLVTTYDDPILTPSDFAIPNIDGIGDDIECLKAFCRSMPDQFFSDLASKINPEESDILISELKSLVDKIFWVLDNAPNSSHIIEVKELVQYLFRVYNEGCFHDYKNKISLDIAIFFKKYLLIYTSINFHRFKGDMDRFRRGLANPSSADRDSLELMNKWVFYYGTHIIVWNFRHLLEAIFGKSFRDITIEYLIWENKLVRAVENKQRKIGFEECAIQAFLELKIFPSEHFIKWVSTSWKYVFNEVLVCNFTRCRQYNPDTFNYLYKIYDSLKVFAKWVEKGEDPTSLVPLLILLDTFSTEGFSGSKDNFDFFFSALQQFYVRMIFYRCKESLLLRKTSYDSKNFALAEVKNEIENNVGLLTVAKINFLKLEFEKYADIIEFFKDLIYKDENGISEEGVVEYDQFSELLKFILELFAKICGEKNCDDLFQLMSYEAQ